MRKWRRRWPGDSAGAARDELTLYLVHGLLHLCGYDDLTPRERRMMRERERAILAELGIVWPGGRQASPIRPTSCARRTGASRDVWMQAAAVSILVVIALVGSFACEALRSFSRSRLDEACRRVGAPGAIRRHTQAVRRRVDCLADSDVALSRGPGGARGRPLCGRSQPSERQFAIGWPSSPSRFCWRRFLYSGFSCCPGAWPASPASDFSHGAGRCSKSCCAECGCPSRLVRRIDAFMHRLWGLKEPAGHTTESLLREVESVVDLGQREGILAPQARRMIERVIAAQQEDVAAVMTPRTEMECVPAAASLEEARLLMVAGGHSRMPVIGTSPDDIVGILYAKELLRHMSTENADPPLSLKDVVREPFYVPETIGLDKLLESMKRRGVHIAIVIDEYSGVAGLVTMEDVLEQIVGEIVDEYDTADDTGIRQVGPAAVEVEPWVRIDDLDEQFAFDLPDDEDYDTVGGFVYAAARPDPQASRDGRVEAPAALRCWMPTSAASSSSASRTSARPRRIRRSKFS